MTERDFIHYDLRLVEPDFDSPLTDLIIDLDHLRRKRLEGSTHEKVFFQLKSIFHLLESLGSARIEGNNTTLAEYVEAKEHDAWDVSGSIREIENLEGAMDFIEEHVLDHPINRFFVSELHKRVVDGLTPPPFGEGDPTPGKYRSINLEINQATHRPPEHVKVPDYMDEFFAFIGKEHHPKYDLLKTAIAHHRFVWIHPFRNGNGRTVRLLTYAMLLKQGFNLRVGRIVNPTAIFCSDRDAYYFHLANADSGNDKALLDWCQYVLGGLQAEIEKIDRLCNYNYLQKEILLPAIDWLEKDGKMTDVELRILQRVVQRQVIQASDLKPLFPSKVSAEISRQIRRLLDKQVLLPEAEGRRKYILNLRNRDLFRSVIHQLGKKGFLPANL